MAWALANMSFAPFLVGAFWMGVAQGFSLFYRHEAAIGSSASQRFAAVALVFGAGALAGFAGPALAELAERIATGFYVGTALLAAAAQFVALSFAALTSRRLPVELEAPRVRAPDWLAMLAPTLVAALAWFSMNLVMLAAPFSMIGCGVGAAAVMGARHPSRLRRSQGASTPSGSRRLAC